MSLRSTILSDLAAVESILQTDLLQAAGIPVLTFLQKVQANQSASNIAGQWIVLQASLIASLPTLEATSITQLAGWLASKLETLVTIPASTPALAAQGAT